MGGAASIDHFIEESSTQQRQRQFYRGPKTKSIDGNRNSENLHIRVVKELLEVIQQSASEDLSDTKKNALAIAVNVLSSSTLEDRIKSTAMRNTTRNNHTDEYNVQPVHETIREQVAALKASFNTNQPNTQSSSSTTSSIYAQRAIKEREHLFSVDNSTKLGAKNVVRFVKISSNVQKTQEMRHVGKRTVSFRTNRTLRGLSISSDDAAGSSNSSSHLHPNFADYKCYIPRAVLKEILTFTSVKPGAGDNIKSIGNIEGMGEDSVEHQNIANSKDTEIYEENTKHNNFGKECQSQRQKDDESKYFHVEGGYRKATTQKQNVLRDDMQDTVFTATKPYQRSYEAAVLFADMSGFTALTERLSAEDNGAELLCMALNDFFGVMLEIVAQYGGDCVKFAGDALCVLWPVQKEKDPQVKAKSRFLIKRQVTGDLDDVMSGNTNPWHYINSLEHAVVAAAACSAEIHRQLADYPPAHGVKLTLHMGLGAGLVKMLFVGGVFGRWEFVVSGPPMKQIAVAEPLAKSGQTVCSPEAWKIVMSYFHGINVKKEGCHDYIILGQEKNDGNSIDNVVKEIEILAKTAPWSRTMLKGQMKNFDDNDNDDDDDDDENIKNEDGEENEDADGDENKNENGYNNTMTNHTTTQQQNLRNLKNNLDVSLNIGLTKSFIPNAIYQQLAAGYTGNMNAEMREISVIFVKITGLELNGQHALEDMQKMMVAVQESTYLFEGSVNKLLIDDKGLLILLGFGLPPLAHEDDPLRAVAAACEIRQRLSLSPHGPHLTTHIGITTGENFCGVIGSRVRREYTVMGDLVNLSARLMGTADANMILVDDNTAMRCVGHVQFHTMPPLHLKGKVKAVQLFAPDGWFTQYNEPYTDTTGKSVSSNNTSQGNMLSIPSLRNISSPHDPQKDPIRQKYVQKIINTIERGHSGQLTLVIGEAGVGKSACLAKVVSYLDPKKILVVGVDFDNIASPSFSNGHHSAATPWCKRMTEIGTLPSFQAWKLAFLQVIANYLYDHPAEAHHRTVAQAYIEVILKLVPIPIRRYVGLIQDLFPELLFNSSDTVLTAIRESVEGSANSEGTNSGNNENTLTKSEQVEMKCRILISILRNSVTAGRTLLCVLDNSRSFDSFSWTLLNLLTQVDPNSFESEGQQRHGYTFTLASDCTDQTTNAGGKVQVVVMSRPVSATSHKYRNFAWMVQRAARCFSLHHLTRLEPQECTLMIHQHLQAKNIPKEVLLFVTSHSHGNPLHIIELCRYLVAEQLVYVLNGKLSYTTARAHKAIAASQTYLYARGLVSYPRVLIQNARSSLDSLTPTEQFITKVASVLPQHFVMWQLLYIVQKTRDSIGMDSEIEKRHKKTNWRQQKKRMGKKKRKKKRYKNKREKSKKGENRKKEKADSGDSDSEPEECQFSIDTKGHMYEALEQLVLRGIIAVAYGTESECIKNEAQGRITDFYDVYELNLPLAGNSIMIFHSPTIRSCAKMLLLSTQKKQIRKTQAQAYFKED